MGVTFVGSTPVAKIVYETASKAGKRVLAQGGAKNPEDVMPDANLGENGPQLAQLCVQHGQAEVPRCC